MKHSEIFQLTASELEAEIQKHNRLYWELNAPTIEDSVYDALVERLRELAPDSAILEQLGTAHELAPAGGDAATAGAASSDRRKVTHEQPMLSLDKCYTEPELRAWFDRFERGDALATHKIDGVAISIRYDAAGNLVLGATRGNGTVGEDITENCRHVGNIPHKIEISGPLEIRGEAYMPLSVFKSRFADEFANPRNLAAGALKLIDGERTADYGLRFFAYDALGLDGPTNEAQKRERLAALGFTPTPGTITGADEGFTTFEKLAAERDNNDFETDGIVFRVNDTARYLEMGMTAHHPRGAIAFKYQGDSGTTQVREIHWSVSRSGTINPVAQVDPVSLSGVTVSRVSLHNLAIMEELADAPLQIGSNAAWPLSSGAGVIVTRRGGVIPHIESLTTAGSALLEVPETCPSCGASTFRQADFLAAEHHSDCTTQGIRALEHFAKTVDLRGFGEKLLEQLWDQELAREPADLYALQAADLRTLERMGDKSAANLIAELEAHKEIPLATFLSALGIPGLGGQTARVLVDTFVRETSLGLGATAPAAPEVEPQADSGDLGPLFAHAQPATPPAPAPAPASALKTMDRIRRASVDDFARVEGIAQVAGQKIVDGLAQLEKQIDALLGHVDVVDPEPLAPAAVAADDDPVAGRSFVFTGALQAMSRTQAQAAVLERGGLTPSGVSRTLDYLVVGDSDLQDALAGRGGSKIKKAATLIAAGDVNLQIISESAFLALIQS